MSETITAITSAAIGQAVIVLPPKGGVTLSTPVVAWAVVTDDEGDTDVQPVFVYDGRAYTGRQFRDEHPAVHTRLEVS